MQFQKQSQKQIERLFQRLLKPKMDVFKPSARSNIMGFLQNLGFTGLPQK